METEAPVKRREADGMSKMPAGLKNREIVVELLDGTTVVVHRWSVSKMFAMFDYIADSLENISDDDVKKILAGSKNDAIVLVRIFGSKLPKVVAYSLDEKYRDAIGDFDAEDFLAILDAVFKLNLTDSFLGKVKTLGVAFVARMKGSGAL
jgi:hypothetical protein